MCPTIQHDNHRARFFCGGPKGRRGVAHTSIRPDGHHRSGTISTGHIGEVLGGFFRREKRRTTEGEGGGGAREVRWIGVIALEGRPLSLIAWQGEEGRDRARSHPWAEKKGSGKKSSTNGKRPESRRLTWFLSGEPDPCEEEGTGGSAKERTPRCEGMWPARGERGLLEGVAEN